jgi:hypothetical protein
MGYRTYIGKIPKTEWEKITELVVMSEKYFSGTKEKFRMYLKEWASEKFNLRIKEVI